MFKIWKWDQKTFNQYNYTVDRQMDDFMILDFCNVLVTVTFSELHAARQYLSSWSCTTLFDSQKEK